MTRGGVSYLADQLHVTVFNTVVDHFDIVTSTLVTNPVTARLAVRLGSDALEDILDEWPGLLVTTGHERGTITGTLLTTGNTGSDESETLLGKVLCSAVAVWVVRVSTVNDDVALFDERKQLLNEVIDGRTSHDQEHDAAGGLELGDKLLDGVGTHDRFACRWEVMSVLVFLCSLSFSATQDNCMT